MKKLPIQDSFLLTYQCNKDMRGTFSEIVNSNLSPKRLWHQISISNSNPFVLRGIHVSPYGKLITCIKGDMHDYIVDLRKSSPTFLMWICVYLSEGEGNQVFIPDGCGHGFVSGARGCTVLYCQEGNYDSSKDLNVVWNDPFINIQWYEHKGCDYILSEKDKNAQNLNMIQGFEDVKESKEVALIIGASGQVGQALFKKLQEKYICVGTYASNVNAKSCQIRLDLADILKDKSELENVLHLVHPKVVILCSAKTNVNECCHDSENCFAINTLVPELFAKECKARNIKFIFFSTDYIFDGICGPYTEDEENGLRPLNTYGISKLKAEKTILSANPSSIVVRTTGVYGPDYHKKNFVYQVVKSVLNKEPMRVANDQVGNPIFTGDLAGAVYELLGHENCCGIYNIAGMQFFTKYEFALNIIESLGFHSDCKKYIIPFSTQDRLISDEKYVNRPTNAGLVVQKLFKKTSKSFSIRGVSEILCTTWNPLHDNCNKIWYAPYKFQAYGREEKEAVDKCLTKGWLAPGQLTYEFEQSVSGYFGKKYGVMVNSGSSANMLALAVLNLKGKEVITPACTFATCVAPMEQLGIIPVFVDVELKRYVPSVEMILSAITPNTGCIFIPNLIGSKIDWKELKCRLPRKDIWLIEDSCDTMTFTQESDISITSFYASHIITAGGCGGMVMFNDFELSKKALMYRDWGRMGTNTEDFGERFNNNSVDGISYDFKFLYGVLGYNFKCCEMNAAFGLEQMKKLPMFKNIRKANIRLYMQRLKNTKYILPSNADEFDWLAFPLMADKREDLLKYLEENNIQVRVCFAGNITRHPAFRHHLKEFPNSDLIMKQGFLLGAHHGLSAEEIDRCCDLLIAFENFHANM